MVRCAFILLRNGSRTDIPKEQAITVDLQEHEGLSIKDVLRPSEYPSRIYEYLGIEERLGYLIENRSV